MRSPALCDQAVMGPERLWSGKGVTGKVTENPFAATVKLNEVGL